MAPDNGDLRSQDSSGHPSSCSPLGSAQEGTDPGVTNSASLFWGSLVKENMGKGLWPLAGTQGGGRSLSGRLWGQPG